MSAEKENQKQGYEDKPQPSEGPLKNEPTPERAHEEKAKQEQKACPEPS